MTLNARRHVQHAFILVYCFHKCITAYNLELLIIIDVIIYAGLNSESTATVSIISGTLGSLLVVALLVCGILIIVIAILRKKGNNTTYKGIRNTYLYEIMKHVNAGIKFLSAGIAMSSSGEQKSGQMKVIKIV